MNVENYKCAILEYTCEECFNGNNCVLEFDKIKQDPHTYEGLCRHIYLTFFSTIENNLFNCLVTFHCQKCDKEESKQLINDGSVDSIYNLSYKCECGNGDLHIGLLLQEEVFYLDGKDGNKNIDNNNAQNQNIDNKNDKNKNLMMEIISHCLRMIVIIKI